MIERGDPTKAVDILCRLASKMDIDVVERKVLARLAGDRTGCKERVAEVALKEALAIEREARAQAFRDKASRESTRVRLPALPADTEINPVMETWDEILANTPAAREEGQEFAEPPMRDAEGWPIEIRSRDPPGLHTLSSAGANAEEDEKSRLQAPEQFLLSKHDKLSLEREVGHYITFVDRTFDGERYVAPPAKFVLHYLGLKTSKAPRVHGVMTLPVVLPDGTLLAENGLDRERRVSFRIDQTLMRHIPKREDCTPEAVRAAYKFLTDEWFVDVMTDRKGKATLVAYALSIIERCLIPDRPVYTVTAGQRGGGKTTVLMMIALATLGVKPAAAAWSGDPTERKKALFAYLLEGLPTLIWDNIPRGAAISCPSIERSCTAETYSDRILGITGIGTADAFTIQTFTGNCIRPVGDLASRNLTITITTAQPDPENRAFVHSDPLAWTWDHRGKILCALFTILLAPHEQREGTRFKVWQRLVGSPVEFAANTPDTLPEQRISFQEIFLEGEREGDDEALARGEILQALHGLFPSPPEAGANMPRVENEFSTVKVLACLSASANEAKDSGGPEEEAIVSLRYFCTTRDAKGPTVRSVPKALKSIVGATTAVAGGILTLRNRWDTHKKIPFFWVEFQPELNPDGTKTVEAEAVERAGMDAAAKIAAAAEHAAQNAATKVQVEKMLAARQAAGPINPFGPSVAHPLPKPNGETKPSPFKPGPPPFEDLKPEG